MAVNGKGDLREQLEQVLQGRVCWMGVGNVDYGDDGFGVYLAESLTDAGWMDVTVAGTTPDRSVATTAEEKFDHLVFLDAVDWGGSPGAVVFLDSNRICARFPQISTHKISLGLLAKTVESNGLTKAWLLGVQPQSVQEGEALSSVVRRSMDALSSLLVSLRKREVTAC
jgi:hydrogenase maturation protease